MSATMLICNYSGITYTFDDNGNITGQSGTGPNFATLVPLTLTSCVYEPGTNWNVRDVNGNFLPAQNQLILIFDSTNQAAIMQSVQTITGANIIVFPITYTPAP